MQCRSLAKAARYEAESALMRLRGQGATAMAEPAAYEAESAPMRLRGRAAVAAVAKAAAYEAG